RKKWITTPCTLENYAEAKGLPVEFLRALGLSDRRHGGLPSVRIPFRDAQGNEFAVCYRTALEKNPDGPDNRFRWGSGSKAKGSLYGLDLCGDAEEVVLVEGPSDAQTLWFNEFPTLGIPGADQWDEARCAPLFDRAKRIYVVIEPDQGGETVKGWLARSKIRDRAHIVALGKFKDPSALHVNDPDRFRERFQQALDAAVPFAEIEAQAAKEEREAAWKRCKALAREPDILGRFYDALQERGIVGEERAAKTVYLSLVTRLLPRPMSSKVVGPSAAGKSFIADGVLKFFPASAYYELTSSSERALVYTKQDFRHRFIVIFEAAGIASDLMDLFLRSLLSEGRLRYSTVVKTDEGPQEVAIEKEGPTGLLVTTTAVRLHPEIETRLLTLHATDTREQTRKVMRAIARNHRERPDAVELEPWHALQTWLQHSVHLVEVPYAEALADLIPPVAVRLRRDFGAVLSLIQAHAILHQARREIRDGRIVATLDDYAAVRKLVVDVVSQGVSATVSRAIRQTVIAVAEFLEDRRRGEEPVSVVMLATRLKLDKTSAWRRAQQAIEAGYLVNQEDRERRPARLVLGEPMPEEQPILPDVETIARLRVKSGGKRGYLFQGAQENISPLPPPKPTQSRNRDAGLMQRIKEQRQ
ncbi:MAG: hypothetical protein ACREQL_03845, partial [Candidatus Binatia bacterium]